MGTPFRVYKGLSQASGHAYSTKVFQNQKNMQRPSENSSQVIALFQDEAIQKHSSQPPTNNKPIPRSRYETAQLEYDSVDQLIKNTEHQQLEETNEEEA